MITGVKGSIRWGTPPAWYTAAAIEGYTVTCTKTGQWSLAATVVLSDAFKMAQAPLTFCAMHTEKGLDGKCVVKTEWRWPIVSCALVNHHLTARLGPPEDLTTRG